MTALFDGTPHHRRLSRCARLLYTSAPSFGFCLRAMLWESVNGAVIPVAEDRDDARGARDPAKRGRFLSGLNFQYRAPLPNSGADLIERWIPMPAKLPSR
jgi:hypothetical protein